MVKFIFIFILLFFIGKTEASNKEKIIENLKKIENFSFNFEQNINNKIERGKCIIQYPKKIFCEYRGGNKKILVSDGKILVIQTNNSGLNYKYPIKATPLNLILDKNFLIKKIDKLKPRIINDSYINFTFIEKNNEINIFFDNNTFNLIGWQTLDVYQNINITFISSLLINEKIDQKIFVLPK